MVQLNFILMCLAVGGVFNGLTINAIAKRVKELEKKNEK